MYRLFPLLALTFLLFISCNEEEQEEVCTLNLDELFEIELDAHFDEVSIKGTYVNVQKLCNSSDQLFLTLGYERIIGENDTHMIEEFGGYDIPFGSFEINYCVGDHAYADVYVDCEIAHSLNSTVYYRLEVYGENHAYTEWMSYELPYSPVPLPEEYPDISVVYYGDTLTDYGDAGFLFTFSGGVIRDEINQFYDGMDIRYGFVIYVGFVNDHKIYYYDEESPIPTQNFMTIDKERDCDRIRGYLYSVMIIEKPNNPGCSTIMLPNDSVEPIEIKCY